MVEQRFRAYGTLISPDIQLGIFYFKGGSL